MDSAIIGAGAALLGVLVGGGIQYIMLEQKYLADAIDKTQERQVLLASGVSQYLQFISDIEYAEKKNKRKGPPVPLTKEQRADLSARNRSVVSAAYALMLCGDVELADASRTFLKTFEEYVGELRDITTGNQGEYPPQKDVRGSVGDVLRHKVTLTWPGRHRKPSLTRSE